MRTKTRAWALGVVAGAAAYLYLWLNPVMSNPILWPALCGLAGFLAFLTSDTTMPITLMAVLTGAFSLNVLHIAMDLAADPTSHNLFPFELAFTLLLTGAGAAIGVCLARLVKHWIARPRIEH